MFIPRATQYDVGIILVIVLPILFFCLFSTIYCFCCCYCLICLISILLIIFLVILIIYKTIFRKKKLVWVKRDISILKKIQDQS